MNPVIEEIKKMLEEQKAQLLSGVETQIETKMNKIEAMETRIKEIEEQWKTRSTVAGLVS